MEYLSLHRHSKLRYPLRILEHDGGSIFDICSFRDSHENELLAGPTASSACSIKGFFFIIKVIVRLRAGWGK